LKAFAALPLALCTMLAACSPTAPQPVPLNDTLPKLDLQTLLPAVEENAHCKRAMDAEMLHGVGVALQGEENYTEAKACLAMAAPSYTRALCFLANNVSLEEGDDPEAERKAFHYQAYAASQNDSCAEFGLYFVYRRGDEATPADPALAQRWLERSALHGNANAQRTLIQNYQQHGQPGTSYAWLKILDERGGAPELPALKAKLSAQQLSEGEALYEALNPQVPNRQQLKDEERHLLVAYYTGMVQLKHPTLFAGITPQQRHDTVKRAVDTALDQLELPTVGKVKAYIVVSQLVQRKDANADLLQNPQIVAVFRDDKLKSDEVLSRAQAIVDQAYN